MFENLQEAGRQLGRRLVERGIKVSLVAACARGGVPVGYEVALALGVPLDVLVVRKLGAPCQPELAVGALAYGMKEPVVFHQLVRRLRVPQAYLLKEADVQRREVERQNERFRGGGPPMRLGTDAVVVVDDGLATGMTMRAAIAALRALGAAKVLAAVPVAAEETAAGLEAEGIELVSLLRDPDFVSVGSYFNDFSQTSDERVLALLEQARRRFR